VQQNQNRIKAVIFDWAGTTVDFGCLAPTLAFIRAFDRYGLRVSREDVRKHMGLSKREHIETMLREPGLSKAWRSIHGARVSAEDMDDIYEAFMGLLLDEVVSRSEPIPGVVDTVRDLRDRGIRIGSTTGYPREVMERLAPASSSRGYEPECLVCAGDLSEDRPSPFMIYENMIQLGVWPARSVVKVDDTRPGIEEGLNAGTWTVAVSLTGNEIGMDRDEFTELPDERRSQLVARANRKCEGMGAHYAIDGVQDLPDVIDEIEEFMLNRGMPDTRL